MERRSPDLGERDAGHVIESLTAVGWKHGEPVPAALLIGLPTVVGVAYLLLQIGVQGVAEDAIFVGLLLGATTLLMQGLRYMNGYVRRRAPVFFREMRDREEAERAVRAATRFVQETFSDRWMAAGGAAYGLLVATAAVVTGAPWPDRPLLAALLWVFLLLVNYVAGMGFTGLALLFRALWRSRDALVVTIWRRSNASTRFVDDIRIRAAALCAAYVGLSLSSIALSMLSLDRWVTITYASFAALVILAALSVPGILIRTRLEEARSEAMKKVDVELQAEFRDLFAASSTSDPEKHLEKIDGLLGLRDKIEGLAPPALSWRSVRAALGVVVMTGLPIVVDFVVDWLRTS